MTHFTTTAGVGILLAGLAMTAWSAPITIDPPPKPAAIITFAAPPRAPGKYHLKGAIDFGGGKQSTTLSMETQAGATAQNLRTAVEATWKGQPTWEYVVEQDTLRLTGWTDPKTGQFYPVKKVTFTSDDMPKESMPKVSYTWKDI
jgi:hypothetical protein